MHSDPWSFVCRCGWKVADAIHAARARPEFVAAALTLAHLDGHEAEAGSGVPALGELSSIESRLLDAETRFAMSERALERLNNFLDNYGIPRWPPAATQARLQRMYRAWNIPGADVSLVPFTHEEWAAPAAGDAPLKQQNPCPKCGTWLWDDPRPCWNCKRIAAWAAPQAPETT